VEFFLAGEANGILMAWMIFLALPHVTRTGSHLSLDALDKLAPDWLATLFRVFGYLVMLVYVAVLSWYCGQLAWSSFLNDVRSSSILRWPVIYAQMGVMLGLALLAVTQCLILVADLRSGGRVRPANGASAP
jgi:TRAP-type C4-dicarboxylate transport system permease small subunit